MKVIDVPQSKAPWFCYCWGVRVHAACIHVHRSVCIYLVYAFCVCVCVPDQTWCMPFLSSRTVSFSYAVSCPRLICSDATRGHLEKGDHLVFPFCSRHHVPSFSPSQTGVLTAQPLLPWPLALLHEKIAASSSTL